MQNGLNEQMIPLLVTLSVPILATRSQVHAQVYHIQGSSEDFSLAALP